MKLVVSNQQVIVHIDPVIASTNLGDEIISSAVSTQMRSLFDGCRIINIGSRDIGKWSRRIMDDADYVFFGGSNALSANPIFGYRQFAMGFIPPLYLRNLILMGVGWWQYQNSLGPLASAFYKKIFRHDIVHSVRDEYTLQKLRDLGFKNVVNTGCPTMWGLKEFEATVSDEVVITLTDYNRDFQRDTEILNNALNKFDRVYFWPQGTNDRQYLNALGASINIERISVLSPLLSTLDETLAAGAAYVGTRLHAGVRALQHNRPSYIIPIDNRAIEIAKTESLPLISPQLKSIEPGVMFSFTPTEKLTINQFLEQFR